MLPLLLLAIEFPYDSHLDCVDGARITVQQLRYPGMGKAIMVVEVVDY
jgi:hypothetical protein